VGRQRGRRGGARCIAFVAARAARGGLSIGLNAAQLYGYVLLPQALKRMTPPTINIYTRIIKTSSLAVLIGVVEVIKAGQQIIERTYESVLIYGALFLFFFFCYPLSAASRVLERRWTQA
jgi:polar amino acid transport system permease protein